MFSSTAKRFRISRLFSVNSQPLNSKRGFSWRSSNLTLVPHSSWSVRSLAGFSHLVKLNKGWCLLSLVQVQYSRDRPDVRELPPNGLAGARDEPHEALDERAWLWTLPSCQLRPRLWAGPLALPCAAGGSTTNWSLRNFRHIRLIRSVCSFCSV